MDDVLGGGGGGRGGEGTSKDVLLPVDILETRLYSLLFILC